MLRCFGFYHQDAQTESPELAYLARFLVYESGKAEISNQQVEGAGGFAQNSNSNALNVTEKNNLVARNLSFLERQGNSFNVTNAQAGKSSSGEWLDVVRDMDVMVNAITVAYKDFLRNKSKVSYSQFGLDECRAVLSGTLDSFVSTESIDNVLDGALENPYVIFMPKSSEVDAATKASRTVYITFDAYLSGAVQIVKVTGSLGYGTN